MPRPPTRDIWPLPDKRLGKDDPDFDFRLQKLLDLIEAHGPHESAAAGSTDYLRASADRSALTSLGGGFWSFPVWVWTDSAGSSMNIVGSTLRFALSGIYQVNITLGLTFPAAGTIAAALWAGILRLGGSGGTEIKRVWAPQNPTFTTTGSERVTPSADISCLVRVTTVTPIDLMGVAFVATSTPATLKCGMLQKLEAYKVA